MHRTTWFILSFLFQIDNLDDTYLLTDKCPWFPLLSPCEGVTHH